ncbi:hypothetical protein [Micrococcus cohnii]|uniref:Di-and tripeptidase n=1 Tax=Micrococcus cohnii TaxID=993416 RepID=A0A7W7GQD0_9MICC|nr:hypothetical protein [Micrococcus cohnii]MBB4736372.1 hypothetical protein [Micrococcus cohnii]
MAKNSFLGRMAGDKALNMALKNAFDDEGNPTDSFQKTVLRAMKLQRPLVVANLRRLHENHPDESPAQLADRLSDQYLNTVTGAGAAVGGTAIIPGIGTIAALGLSGVAVIGFLEATALYAQSIAELHGITTEDPQRAEALVMAVMLGEDGRKMLKEFAGSQRGGAAASLGGPGALNALTATGGGMSDMVMNQLKKKFMRKVLVRQGAGLFGRAVPFGVGAVIGGVGNRSMGKSVIASAQNLFGPVPQTLPGDVVETKDEREQAEAARELEQKGLGPDA